MRVTRVRSVVVALVAALLWLPRLAGASEAELVLPDLSTVRFVGVDGWTLLAVLGLAVCILGLAFGWAQFVRIRDLPVHRAMREISELIYETCKTYLITQMRFIGVLGSFIGIIMIVYFRFLAGMSTGRVAIILLFSLVGVLGSCGVAWFGIRVNTFANSRTAFASLRGKPFPSMPSRSRPACRSGCSSSRSSCS